MLSLYIYILHFQVTNYNKTHNELEMVLAVASGWGGIMSILEFINHEGKHHSAYMQKEIDELLESSVSTKFFDTNYTVVLL